MANEMKKPPPVTGRTAWDFAAEVTRRLGPGILILIGIAYGFYKFVEQARLFDKARQEATASVQQQLNDAHKELRETSVAIGNMNKTMIENIQDGFDTLQSLQGRLKDLQEKAIVEAKDAEDAIALRKKAEEARDGVLNQLEKVKAEHDRLQKLRIAKSGPFRDDVKSLLKLLSDKPIDDSEIRNLADLIKQDYLVDPLELFEAVAKDPNLKNLQGLSELEGLKFDTLMQVVKENKADFASWMLVQVEDRSDVVGALGVVRTSEYEARGLIFIDIDEGRVLSVHSATRSALVSFPSEHNWDSNSTGGIVEVTDGEPEYFVLPATAVLTLPRGQRLLSEFWPNEDEGVKFETLVGKEPYLIPIALNDFQRRYPATYNYLLTEEDEFIIAAMMIRKAKTFSAATVVPVDLERGYADVGNLRDTIIQVLGAAVKRDSKKRRALAAENFSESNWGPLAAVALKQQFAVRELSVTPDRLKASVICSFRDQEMGHILRANLTLKRAEDSAQSQWRTTGFAKMPRERPAQSAQRAAR